jgi:carbonic anhydrase
MISKDTAQYPFHFIIYFIGEQVTINLRTKFQILRFSNIWFQSQNTHIHMVSEHFLPDSSDQQLLPYLLNA